MAGFEILPAIDLAGGRVVRLRQGDFARETAYDDNPVSVARGFADAGATLAARRGPRRRAGGGASPVGARVRDRGGGPWSDAGRGRRRAAHRRVGRGRPGHGREPRRGRDGSAARPGVRALAGGALRALARGRLDRHPRRHSPTARAGGSTRRASPPAEAVETLSEAGIDTFEVTAIDRDGLLGGPDIALLRSLVVLGRGRIIASGGISSLADVLAVQAAGCGGAIIGRALYEGRLTVREVVGAIEGDARAH